MTNKEYDHVQKIIVDRLESRAKMIMTLLDAGFTCMEISKSFSISDFEMGAVAYCHDKGCREPFKN